MGKQKVNKKEPTRIAYHANKRRMENKIRNILKNSGSAEKAEKIAAEYEKKFSGRS